LCEKKVEEGQIRILRKKMCKTGIDYRKQGTWKKVGNGQGPLFDYFDDKIVRILNKWLFFYYY
jgi:hypothetical protein